MLAESRPFLVSDTPERDKDFTNSTQPSSKSASKSCPLALQAIPQRPIYEVYPSHLSSCQRFHASESAISTSGTSAPTSKQPPQPLRTCSSTPSTCCQRCIVCRAWVVNVPMVRSIRRSTARSRNWTSDCAMRPSSQTRAAATGANAGGGMPACGRRSEDGCQGWVQKVLSISWSMHGERPTPLRAVLSTSNVGLLPEGSTTMVIKDPL